MTRKTKPVLSSSVEGVALKSSDCETCDTGPSRSIGCNNTMRPNTSNQQLRSSFEEDAKVIVVDTFREKTPKQLEARRYLTSAELVTLKESDPFMYYSIPSVKKAVWEGREVDFDVELTNPVKRSSAVSFENAGDDLCMVFHDNTTSVANGDRKEDLFLSFFGVDIETT